MKNNFKKNSLIKSLYGTELSEISYHGRHGHLIEKSSPNRNGVQVISWDVLSDEAVFLYGFDHVVDRTLGREIDGCLDQIQGLAVDFVFQCNECVLFLRLLSFPLLLVQLAFSCLKLA